MKSVKEILSMISSNDIEVLKLCNNFLDECIQKEHLRGESAERRANIILGVVGAASAFMVFLADNAFSTTKPHALFVVIYAASALWLARSIWYLMKSFRTQSRYRFTAESIFDFQTNSDIEALKQIVAGKYWENEHSIQPNTERLFFVQRAQRSLVTVVGLLLSFGVLLIISNQIINSYSTCAALIVSSTLLVFWLIGDKIIEKSGIWNHK